MLETLPSEQTPLPGPVPIVDSIGKLQPWTRSQGLLGRCERRRGLRVMPGASMVGMMAPTLSQPVDEHTTNPGASPGPDEHDLTYSRARDVSFLWTRYALWQRNVSVQTGATRTSVCCIGPAHVPPKTTGWMVAAGNTSHTHPSVPD